MQHWNKKELTSAKIIVRVEHKMGQTGVQSKDLILRPKDMELKDYETLLMIFESYGKSR